MKRTSRKNGIVLPGFCAALALLGAEAFASEPFRSSGELSEEQILQIQKWSEPFEGREFSASFDLKFDKGFLDFSKESGKIGAGLFECSLDKDRHLLIRLLTPEDDLLGPDYLMRSSMTLEPNRWYHVALNFSNNRRRATLYIDGKFQWENSDLNLPLLQFSENSTQHEKASIRNLKLYDYELDSEALTDFTPSAEEFQKQNTRLSTLIDTARNPSFKNWCTALQKELDAAKKDGSTLSAWKHLLKQIGNAERIASELAGNKGITNQALMVYTVPAISQELRLPYDLPTDGEASSELRLMAAKDEFESASFVVVPFAPVKKLELKISDLKCGADTIPASAIDAKLVKRWIRSGGAWLSYHADKRQRVLVPDLLLNDENLIRVDEKRKTNELRLSYPDGEVYRDVSRYSPGNDPNFDTDREPVRDAATLQSVALPEAGRNQQFYLTFHAPKDAKPGIYRGTITLMADGRNAGTLNLLFRVLPFELPVAKTNYDLDREFFCNITYHPRKSREVTIRELQDLHDHNMRFPQIPDIRRYGEKLFAEQIELRKKIGLPVKPIFCGDSGDQQWRKVPYQDRTMKVYEQCREEFGEKALPLIQAAEKYAGHKEIYFYGNDEAGGWLGLDVQQRPGWEKLEEMGVKLRAAGWKTNFTFMADIQNMHSITTIEKENADLWHSVNGILLNYADPFAGSENPLWFRRKAGLLQYKSNYDGLMLLSYKNLRVPWNELAEDPGGDGNYRNFCMTYPTVDGTIGTLAFEGLREAYDDVRYITLMKQLATEAMNSDNLELKREGKRQLAWFERIDGEKYDLDSLRTQVIDRILTLIELNRAQKGK